MRHGTNRSNTPARRVSWFLVVATTLSLCDNIATAADKEFTLADVRAAWAKRQKRVRTLEIQLDRKYTVLRRAGRDKGNQTTQNWSIVVRIDGEKFDMRLHKSTGLSERNAFDGKTSFTLSSSAELQEGRISSRRHAFGTRWVFLHPITVCYRPLVPTMSGFEFKDLRLEPKKSGETKVDGHLCQMLIRKEADGREYVYYVDPKADFMVRRIESRSKGRRTSQWDISLSHDKKLGWVSSKWTWEFYPPEATLNKLSATVKVTKCEINKPIPKSEFRIEFPPGAKVTDERKRKK